MLFRTYYSQIDIGRFQLRQTSDRTTIGFDVYTEGKRVGYISYFYVPPCSDPHCKCLGECCNFALLKIWASGHDDYVSRNYIPPLNYDKPHIDQLTHAVNRIEEVMVPNVECLAGLVFPTFPSEYYDLKSMILNRLVELGWTYSTEDEFVNSDLVCTKAFERLSTPINVTVYLRCSLEGHGQPIYFGRLYAYNDNLHNSAIHTTIESIPDHTPFQRVCDLVNKFNEQVESSINEDHSRRIYLESIA